MSAHISNLRHATDAEQYGTYSLGLPARKCAAGVLAEAILVPNTTLRTRPDLCRVAQSELGRLEEPGAAMCAAESTLATY